MKQISSADQPINIYVVLMDKVTSEQLTIILWIINNLKYWMNSPRIGLYGVATPLNRKKKLEITAGNNIITFKRQNYQEANPYALNRNPSTQLLQRTPNSTESLSNRQTLTQTSSQRSNKVIRANGLRKAEKPNLTGSKVVENGGTFRTSAVGETSPYRHENGSHRYEGDYRIYAENDRHLKYLKEENSVLKGENKSLQEQNIWLKEQMTKLQLKHSHEVSEISNKMEKLFRLTAEMQEQIRKSEQEWKKQMSILQKNGNH